MGKSDWATYLYVVKKAKQIAIRFRDTSSGPAIPRAFSTGRPVPGLKLSERLTLQSAPKVEGVDGHDR